MASVREPVQLAQLGMDALQGGFPPNAVLIDNNSAVSQDRGSSSQSNSQSESSDDEGGEEGHKVKRRRKRQVGTAGEGRGEWNLRTTCDGCTVSKVRCNGKKPCARCERRNEECVYSEKRRCGPKRRKQRAVGAPRVPSVVTVPPVKAKPGDASGGGRDGEGELRVGAPGAATVAGTPSPQSGQAAAAPAVLLSTDEQQFLSAFLSAINSFMPIASAATLREAMLPAPMLDVAALSMGHAAPREREISRFHACKAVLLGSVALGAMYLGEPAAGARYMEEARAHLRDCFDAVIPETAACYLLLVLYHVHVLDSARMFRYMGFAQQSFTELSQQVQAANCEISAAIALLSALLHVSCDSAISLDPVADASGAFPRGGKARSVSSGGCGSHCGGMGGACGGGVGGQCGGGGGGAGALDEYGSMSNSRVLMVLARALVHIDTTSRGEKSESTNEMMLEALSEADTMVSRAMARSRTGAPDAPPPPADLAVVAVKVMAGYFRLQAGGVSKADMMSRVAVPVLEAVRRTPLLLNFPLGWHLARSTRGLLPPDSEDAKTLQDLMGSYEQRLPFASKCCQSSRVIYDCFMSFNWSDQPNTGGAAPAAAAASAAQPPAPPSQHPTYSGQAPGAASSHASAAMDRHHARAAVPQPQAHAPPPYAYGAAAPGAAQQQHGAHQQHGAQQPHGGGGGAPPPMGLPWDPVGAHHHAHAHIPQPDEFLFRQGSFDMMRMAVPTLAPVALPAGAAYSSAMQRGLDVGVVVAPGGGGAAPQREHHPAARHAGAAGGQPMAHQHAMRPGGAQQQQQHMPPQHMQPQHMQQQQQRGDMGNADVLMGSEPYSGIDMLPRMVGPPMR